MHTFGALHFDESFCTGACLLYLFFLRERRWHHGAMVMVVLAQAQHPGAHPADAVLEHALVEFEAHSKKTAKQRRKTKLDFKQLKGRLQGNNRYLNHYKLSYL